MHYQEVIIMQLSLAQYFIESCYGNMPVVDCVGLKLFLGKPCKYGYSNFFSKVLSRRRILQSINCCYCCPDNNDLGKISWSSEAKPCQYWCDACCHRNGHLHSERQQNTRTLVGDNPMNIDGEKTNNQHCYFTVDRIFY